MTEQGNARKQEQSRSFTMRVIMSPFLLVVFLLSSMLISIVLEVVGMFFWGSGIYSWWPGIGDQHSAHILKDEIGYLAQGMRQGLSSIPTLSEWGLLISNEIYYYLFQWLPIEQTLTGLAERSATNRTGFGFYEVIHATLNSAQIFIIRLTIVILAIPLFALFTLWGFTEGLIRRDLRRFGGDIERGYVFHHVKRYAGFVIAFPMILYLALPFSLHPGFIFPPTALLYSLCVMALSATFIKQI